MPPVPAIPLTRICLLILIALPVYACGAHGNTQKAPTKEAYKAFAPFHPCLQGSDCQARIPRESRSRGRGSASIFTLPFLFYKNVVSPTDGPRCHHYPTCSAYALQAVRKHGPWLGALMAMNRVTAPAGISSALRDQPIFLHHGVPRYLDPLDANDFWIDP
jgi:hypothetical protein